MQKKYEVDEKYIITANMCDGKEKEFFEWMIKKYPDIETVTTHMIFGGGFYVDGRLVESNFLSKFQHGW